MPLGEATPLDTGAALGAEHDAVVPPLVPLQLHVHGPVPLAVEAVPMLHRLVVGVVVAVTPLLVPHAPFTDEFAGVRGSLLIAHEPLPHDHQKPPLF